jgi:hypothetical protein
MRSRKAPKADRGMRELHAKVREFFPISVPHGLLDAENVTA